MIELEAVVRLMGDDVPAGFRELAMLCYGPGSMRAGTEPCDGPYPHDMHWGARCRSRQHGRECVPFPSTFELLVRDCLAATGRPPVGLYLDDRDERRRFLSDDNGRHAATAAEWHGAVTSIYRG